MSSFKKNTWAWRLHYRSGSVKSQTAPLIPVKSRPLSMAFNTVVEEEQANVDVDVAPSRADSSTVVPASVHGGSAVTTNSPKADSGHTEKSSPINEKESLPPPVVQSRPAGSLFKDVSSLSVAASMSNIKRYLEEEIDGSKAAAPLTAYCFMTGFIDSVCFSAIFVWCAFQTGNSVQLALALARLFNGAHDLSFHLPDQQALCSVISFIFGAFIGRLGDKLGCKTRLWMMLGTLIQTLFTMAAAIAIWKSGQPSVADARSNPAWSNALSFVCVGFMSASMGLQGIMGKRMNTQFTTTVVLTTTWCELMTEPQLFHFRRLVIARDHKVMAILFLFLGGFTGRAILDQIGSAGTLGVGTGLRFVISLWWLFVPAKKAPKN
ncbi:hypothetical protein ID866_7741 [Astraeus odoratus]|nr:hypothetical protein ID866_7741 [Astraeus odoratus]